MTVTFVHLSDIHFGQEKKGGELHVNNDVKERLLDDVSQVAKKIANGKVTGVIITGDIVYSGKPDQYQAAGAWLDKLTAVGGCEPTDVQVVPGNHDVDRNEITRLTREMLKNIVDGGESVLDDYLSTQRDREVLYGRFSAYRTFADGYKCSLDKEGGGAGDRIVNLSPHRSLRFVGLNTALICSEDDVKGKLLLGKKQQVLPITKGQELVVLAHHPLTWLRDSEEARRYIKSRARVFIAGHEHEPAVHVEMLNQNCHLMTLSAGATIPPNADDKYFYSYNFLQFSWDHKSDGLRVLVHPRKWCTEKKIFIEDTTSHPHGPPDFILGCPNFQAGPKVLVAEHGEYKADFGTVSLTASQDGKMNNTPSNEVIMPAADITAVIALKFFRDLSSAQRLNILVSLGALPDDWKGPVNHVLERRALDSLLQAGKMDAVQAAIDTLK